MRARPSAPITFDEIDTILDYPAQVSTREIARKHGHSSKTVQLIRARSGIKSEHPKAKRTDEWTREQIMLAGPVNNRELGRRLGISNVAVLKLKRRLGIPPNPRGRPLGS